MSPKRRNPNRNGAASPSNYPRAARTGSHPYWHPRLVNGTLLFLVSSVKGRLRATSGVLSVYLQIADVLIGYVGFDRKDEKGYYDAMLRPGGRMRSEY